MSETHEPSKVSYDSAQGLSPQELDDMVKAEFSRPPICSEEDAFEFFAGQPEPVAPAGDLVGKMLVVMFLLAIVGFMVSVGLTFVSTGAALAVSLPSLAMCLTTIVIATVTTPR